MSKKYEQLAKDIVRLVGGNENVDSLHHCQTRLRFKLVDDSKADLDAVSKLPDVLVLKIGVAGVAYPTLIARTFSAAVITILCFSRQNPVYYEKDNIFTWDGSLLRRVLGIAVPNGVESGIFQFVKVALSSVIALFGTYQIAANGIAQSIWSMAALVTSSMGPVFITVIGQTMGAGDIDGAEREFKRLIKITLLFSLLWNGLIFAAAPVLMRFYAIASETKELVILLVLIHNTFNALAFPFADSLGKGLRATGDVRFPTAISIFTTVGVRLVFSYLFGIVFSLGVLGIAWAMCLDWTTRGIIFYLRFRSKKWANFQVI